MTKTADRIPRDGGDFNIFFRTSATFMHGIFSGIKLRTTSYSGRLSLQSLSWGKINFHLAPTFALPLGWRMTHEACSQSENSNCVIRHCPLPETAGTRPFAMWYRGPLFDGSSSCAWTAATCSPLTVQV